MRVVLLPFEPYGPWDVERRAAEAAGGRLAVVPAERFMADPPPADVVLNVCAAPLAPDVIERVHGLRCVVGYGVGTAFIDVGDAARRGIAVVNMPHANVEEVATHALSLILACARRLRELDAAVREGAFHWPRSRPLHRLRGRRLGLLAFGNIARRLAELAAPLGLAIAAYDPFVDDAAFERASVARMDADELFAWADIVSVHLPSTPATRGFVDARRIASLRPGAILVVTSRGDVYDVDAVADSLRGGRLAAAGLDVFPREPLAAGEPITRLPNAVLTPHVAGLSEESIADLHAAAAAIIERLAAGELPAGLVSSPAEAP
jgi:D-3-phosphoglycerate dehydrogenase